MVHEQREDLPFGRDETVYTMFDGDRAVVRRFFDGVDEKGKVFEFPSARLRDWFCCLALANNGSGEADVRA